MVIMDLVKKKLFFFWHEKKKNYVDFNRTNLCIQAKCRQNLNKAKLEFPVKNIIYHVLQKHALSNI